MRCYCCSNFIKLIINLNKQVKLSSKGKYYNKNSNSNLDFKFDPKSELEIINFNNLDSLESDEENNKGKNVITQLNNM